MRGQRTEIRESTYLDVKAEESDRLTELWSYRMHFSFVPSDAEYYEAGHPDSKEDSK